MASTPSTKKRAHSSTAAAEAQAPVRTSAPNKRLKHNDHHNHHKPPGGQNVRVVARVRPLSTKEKNESSKESIQVVHSTTIHIQAAIGGRGGSHNTPKSFEYDGAFGPDTTQQQLYEHTVGDMVRNNCFKGFNVTVMAYGQTGSGKTFTMGTEGGASVSDATSTTSPSFGPPAASDGIIPRAVYDVFDQRRSMPQGEDRVTIEMSYLEIYNEEARDLLITDGEPTVALQIRDSATEGVVIQNLSTKPVSCPQDVTNFMNEAATRRATASTAMNAVSSRSHAICTLNITIAPLTTTTTTTTMDDEEATAEMRAKLTLVDLAGSERIKRTGAEGKRMKEGININKGLFVLGQCVSALSELGQQGKSAAQSNSHVPYRSSKLTRILQDSLGGNSRTVMVACISPADSNVEETVNTLRYAQRTRSIQNSAVRNVVANTNALMSVAEATALQRENEQLKQQLAQAHQRLKIHNHNHKSRPAAVETSLATTAEPVAPTIKPSNSNGAMIIDVSKLDTIQQLQSTISSLESKVESLEQQQQSSADDLLEASIRADKWQLRCEQVEAAAKEQGVTVEATTTTDKDNDNGMDLLTRLRNEIASLKTDLHEAWRDAAVARATAAAVVASNGDLSMASTINSDGESNSSQSPSNSTTDNEALDAQDKEEKLALTAELVSVSGGIEAKQAMADQMNKEFEAMEAMRCHFENAVKSLQDEVGVLAAERETLLVKVGEDSDKKSSGGHNKKNSKEDTQRMKKRINDLETKISNLRQKAAEHTKSLRLREAAEKKCAKLAAEIQADKKRRVTLQKQLKEQASELRTEKMAAKKHAQKLLRDSNKLKLELQKVKDAAARQAVVIRRKATEALNKQKRAAELQAKKQQHQEERKQLAAMRANNSKLKPPQSSSSTSPTAPDSPSSVLGDRKEELQSWLDREIDSASAFADVRSKLKEQKELVSEANGKKMQLHKRHTFIRSSGNKSVNPPSSLAPALKSLDEEIEMRSGLIEALEDNLKELIKASSSSHMAQASPASPGKNLLAGLSNAEAKTVLLDCFQRILRLKQNMESVETTREEGTARAVNVALLAERRAHEDSIVKLKMDHSQAMMDLLNSTKGSIEQSVRLNSLNSVVDAEFQESVEQMLSGYLDGCNKVSESVQGELNEVKEAQEGMKQMVESIATDIMQKTGKASNPKAKKKKQTKNRQSTESTDSLLEEFRLLEAEEAEQENDNSDDSDWSPSRHRTPGRRRRGRRSADSVAKEDKPKQKSKQLLMMEEALAASNALAETMEGLMDNMDTIPEGNNKNKDKDHASKMEEVTAKPAPDSGSPLAKADSSDSKQDADSKAVAEVPMEEVEADDAIMSEPEVPYEKLKVKELREKLRSRGLTVSGNKSELISRLRDDDQGKTKKTANTPKEETSKASPNESKENARETRRSSTRSNRNSRGSLQSVDSNKPAAASTSGKSKSKTVMLPATPPPTTKKGTAKSTKKIASVRRSTMFNRKSVRMPSLSPGVENETNANTRANAGSNLDQENDGAAFEKNNEANKPRANNGLRLRRNLGAQLSKAGGNGAGGNGGTRNRALQQLERNFIP